jgi:cyanophycinase-like exopeptidase
VKRLFKKSFFFMVFGMLSSSAQAQTGNGTSLSDFPQLDPRYALDVALVPTGYEISYASGGGEVKIYPELFVDGRKIAAAKGELKPRVLVISVASQADPAGNADGILQTIAKTESADSYTLLGRIEHYSTTDDELAAQLKMVYQADIIVWSGGAQDREVAFLRHSSQLTQAIRGGYHLGRYANAGSSAGAAAQAFWMVAGGPDDGRTPVRMERGAGYAASNIIIDTHYKARGRDGRMIPYMKLTPRKWMFGLEQNGGSIRIQGMSQITVLGDQELRVIDSRLYDQSGNPRIYTLFSGDKVDTTSGQIEIAPQNVGRYPPSFCPIELEGSVRLRQFRKARTAP